MASHPQPKCSSEPDASVPDKLSRKALRQIEFVVRQISRFQRMSAQEMAGHLKKDPTNIFKYVPDPKGSGSLYCGGDGWARLYSLTDTVLSLDPELAVQVSRQHAFNELRKAFTQCVLLPDRQPDLQVAGKLLRHTLQLLRKSLTSAEHHFPCVMFVGGGVTKFSIGPVVFTKTRLFLRERRTQVSDGVEASTEANIRKVEQAVEKGYPRHRAYTPSESRKMSRDLLAGAIRQYRHFPWVASVQVAPCDPAMSRERGYRAVELSLHSLRVVLGADRTRLLRIAWEGPDAPLTAHLYTDTGGRIYSQLTRNFAPGGGAWHEELCKLETEVDVLGAAINRVVDPSRKTDLHQRMIDAIGWFGDAATDRVPSSAIVKYVTAVERLLFGARDQERKKSFVRRIHGVLDAFGSSAGERTREDARQVYDKRSALLHGGISPESSELPRLVSKAEELSRICILCCTQLYPMMLSAFAQHGERELDEVIERVCANGVAWLAALGGWTLTQDTD